MYNYINKLKDYLQNYEITAFGPLLARFKEEFSHSELNSSCHNIVYKKGNIDSNYSVIPLIKNVIKKTDQAFKNFVLSSAKEIEYDNCRLLKKVVRPDLLVNKFTEDENFKNIEASTKSLLTHIDEKGHVYYAIANSLEGSDLEQFPKELIGHIFHYVDGNINMNLTENNAFSLSNLTGELTLEPNDSVPL